jgi:Reverse transcriptase (RNA-dependent DNA polymerase)
VELLNDKKVLKNKWVYWVKFEGQQVKLRYKTWLVVKGFDKKKKKGVDFEEIFSSVVKISSIRVVLGLAANLHDDLEENLYIEQFKTLKRKK